VKQRRGEVGVFRRLLLLLTALLLLLLLLLLLPLEPELVCLPRSLVAHTHPLPRRPSQGLWRLVP
jgi:hypothetical protein